MLNFSELLYWLLGHFHSQTKHWNLRPKLNLQLWSNWSRRKMQPNLWWWSLLPRRSLYFRRMPKWIQGQRIRRLCQLISCNWTMWITNIQIERSVHRQLRKQLLPEHKHKKLWSLLIKLPIMFERQLLFVMRNRIHLSGRTMRGPINMPINSILIGFRMCGFMPSRNFHKQWKMFKKLPIGIFLLWKCLLWHMPNWSKIVYWLCLCHCLPCRNYSHRQRLRIICMKLIQHIHYF